MRINISTVKSIVTVVILTLGLPLFQSCSDEKSGNTSSGSSANGDFDFWIYDPSFEEVFGEKPTIDVGKVYNLKIDTSALGGSMIFWEVLFLGASCDLKVFASKDSAALSCTSGGDTGVGVTALFEDGREYYTEFRGFVFDSGIIVPGSNIPPQLVEIPLGSGDGDWAWRGRGSRTVYLGEPIRILNLDDQMHQPQTTNSIPCKSAPFPLEQDQSYDCVVKSELVDPDKYILDALNPSAGGRFTFKTIDSQRVYNSFNCSGCHGIKFGDSLNDLRTQLDNAIMNVPGMASYSSLTNEEREAIVFYMYYQPN